jgi:signal transduction histidine kinase
MNTGQESAAVLADRARLGQVIRNFMSNALRHVDINGEIWISITKGKNNVNFCIENQGVGIPEGKMDRIWERFYRIEPSRARENGGTGLGLAISSKILQLHDAQFGVQNTERGVMFYFNIPQ